MLINFKDKIIETNEIKYAQIITMVEGTYIEIKFKGDNIILVRFGSGKKAKEGMEELSELIKKAQV